ncbi:MAG: IcmV [uncultured bacterium]|nr:MAG: IcmV [uncultured bacterium]
MPEEKQVKVEQVAAKKQEIVIKKRGPIKKLFKSFVDVKKWMSYDEVVTNTKTTIGLFRRLISYSKPEAIRHETYEEAVARLGMTEAQLLNRKKAFLYSALVYGAFALVLFIYLIYLLVNAYFFAAFFDLILACLLFLTAYLEHFWYMQMQKKKLGCGFQDWLNFILPRGK